MARERYLLHAGEEEINKLGAEKKADTAKSKWDNFWYYHKLHIVVVFSFILLIGFFIHDFTSNVTPDYQIGRITQNAYSDETTKALEDEIAKYGEDLNSDGKVIVRVVNYVIADDTASGNVDVNMQAAGYTRLSADLAIGESMIFITDDASFRNQQKKTQIFSCLDGSMPKDGATDFKNMRIGLKDCKKLSNVANGMEDLSISLRVYKGTQSEGKKGKDAYFTASKKLLNQLISK